MTVEKNEILYVVSTLRKSGPTTQLLGLINELDFNAFDVQVLTLSPEPTNTDKNIFLNNGIKIDSLNLSRLQYLISGKRKLKQYINNCNPKIVHTSGIRADVAVSKLSIEAEHCMTIHNYVYDDYIAKFGKFIGTFASKSAVRAMNRSGTIICCSNTLKEMYEKKINKKISSIQNGININKNRPVESNDEKIKIRHKLNIPIDKKVYIMVGSLIDRKDPLTVIEAFNHEEILKDGLLLILGDGELLTKCEKMSNESIKVLGNKTNVEEYIKASDVYISASKSEGLPYSVLEAGCSGLDMILSSIPQHKEVLHESKSSFNDTFFEVGNTEELSKLIKRRLQQDLSPFFTEIQQMRREFSEKRMSNEYQAMYLKIVK